MDTLSKFSLEQRQELPKAQEFWQQILEGFIAPTPFIVDKHGSVCTATKPIYEKHEIKLSRATTSALQALTQDCELAIHTLLQGTWSLLLSYYNGENDILFGMAKTHCGSGMPTSGTVAGLLFDPLPLKVRIVPEMSLLSWLQELQALWIAWQDYEYIPLDKIREWSDIPYGEPLFESILVVEGNQTDSSCQRKDENWNNRNSPLVEQIRYPLNIHVFVDSELLIVIEYDNQRFEQETITRMLGHLQSLLLGMVDNPHQCLSELCLLTEAEQHQLLVEWNNTKINYPQDKCIHQLFEDQVERSPDAVAVVFGNQQLTYRELNYRANQLANHLRTLGVAPEVLVGICLERSLEMLVGLLAILKAGGAYVPLDPAYPRDRLGFMLQDSQVPVLLTQEQLVARLPQHKARIVCLDADWDIIAQHSEENIVSNVKKENLAYVIYTSGSTGKPKGVLVLHQGLANFLNSMSSTPGLTDQDILLAVTTISFDIAALELYLPLIVGSQVVLVSREVASDGSLLLDALTSSKATVMQATPATWRLLLASGWKSDYRLKVLCGGEALPRELANQLLERSSSVWNVYGPTETTIWSTADEVGSGKACVSIGRPIANTQIYILNSSLQPVPIGVPGELYIGGDGLTRGYLNRPQLSAEKFIRNPFSQGSEARIYKTGDLARYLPSGKIECLGRIDYQVKIRGFRIELGEIESLLSQNTRVKQNVVIAREDTPGDKRLVAYIVPTDNQGVANDKLRSFLKASLPDHMIPSAFVCLDELPLTPNGKVDRRALPAPNQTVRKLDTTFVAPQNALELQLSNIWEEVLGIQPIGAQDNFFELGGHSLLVTQVISRLRQVLHVELTLRDLFERPTVTQLAEHLALYHDNQANSSTAFTLKPLPREQNFTLSSAQQRLWFLAQLQPNSSAYNLSYAYRLKGQLNIVALEQSLRKIVQRHDALRTTFDIVNGQPVQVMAADLHLTLPIINLVNISETEREREVWQRVRENARQPFDLVHEPLLKLELLCLAAEEYLLLVNMHHIISDGWSMGLFEQEMAVHYQAFCNGMPSPLPELPIQYADFAQWQQQWLQSEEFQSQLNYWKEKLVGAPALLELPTDRSRPSAQTYAGSRHSIKISPELTEAIKALSQQEGVTLFMTLLAAFKVFLARYSGQEDIVVGSPIAGRNRPEIEKLIGFFVNTLALRTSILGNLSFRSLLAQVREVALEAYDHQDLPFDKLVEELQPERNLSYNPITQVMFVLQNTTIPTQKLPGLTLNSVEVENSTSQFDLTLELKETSAGFQGWFEYNTDLFEATTIERMAGHFQTLIEAIVANPETPIAQLPLLTAMERHQLLVEWNMTQVDYPQEKCVHQLIEAQVELSPSATAVVHQGQKLSYEELNNRANQLAHYLRSLGVKSDVVVGICLERSLEMAVGFLGILKAGGAYLPLDPNYPSDRLAFMLDDSQAPIVLTQQSLVEFLPSSNAKVVCLDHDWQAIAQHNQFNPFNQTIPENLAYLIYTSGSTGKPKGVMITHQGMVNHNVAVIKEFNLRGSDRVLQFSSISFDIAVEEIFPTWLSGAALILRSEDVLSSALDFLQFVKQERLTVLNLPTAFWHELVYGMSLDKQSLLETVRLVVVGGERASRSAYTVWLQLVGNRCRWLNSYGPTETTVSATIYDPEANPEYDRTLSEIPIGRPLSNTQLYILDRHLQPVPVGVPGELHIGGVGLARGYLNRLGLTEQRFIPNPFINQPEARLYKTGDLVRYLPDGNIEFIGRIDNQVKIRGFRIELGEIEAVLEQHQAVQQAVVVAREDVPGQKQLVAYLVTHQNQDLTTIELRRFFQKRLPDYMIPSLFVMLDAMLMTPNGKVDRRALPVPIRNRSELQEAFVAPQDELARQLTIIWEDVLGIAPIGVHDNFFELGGHSLLAVRLFAKIEELFGKNLPLVTLFQAPTIERLASTLREQDWSASWSSLVTIRESGSKPPLFCIHGGGFNVLVYHDLANYLGPDYPVYGLQAQGLDGTAVIHGSFEDMATDYIKQMQTVQPEGPYLLAGISNGGVIALEMAQQLQVQGQKVALLAMIDTHGPDDEDKVLPPIPRLLSVLRYALQYTVPRFVEKRRQLGFKAVLDDALKEVRNVSQRISGTQKKEESVEQLEALGVIDTIDYLPKKMNFLELWVHNFHMWILERSQLAFAAPEVEVLGRGGSLSDAVKKLKAAHLEARLNYTFNAYSGRIIVFRAEEQLPGFESDPQFGWGSIALGGLEIYNMPGYHADTVKSPLLAEKMRECMDKASKIVDDC